METKQKITQSHANEKLIIRIMLILLMDTFPLDIKYFDEFIQEV